jgi:DNA-directed RNA polymerase specialized sigma24 family protein
MSDPEFASFLERLRRGDPAAAVELVRRYEGAIRTQIRLRLTDVRVSRLLDSVDVCQSVMASFFVRAAAGEYDLAHPEQLFRLLVVMARHKLSHAIRRERAQRRGGDTARAEGVALESIAGGAEPSTLAAGRELLAEVRRRMTDDERAVADARGEGRDWAEIAGTLGGTADGRRKQLSRALDRVSKELGLDE